MALVPEEEIQALLAQAQHLLTQAEVRVEKFTDMGARNEKLEEGLDAAQRILVDLQLSLVSEKEGGELLRAFFRDGASPYKCEVEWMKSDRVLKIFIPDSWERVNTRPSIYIKDILKYRNASDVRLFYSRLIQAILSLAESDELLEGLETFEKCYAGFLFHFEDRYVRDPNNFLVKILIDAAKNAGVFYADDYEHLIHFAGGVRDARSGLTMYFSDSMAAMRTLETDLKDIQNGKNHMHLSSKKLHATDEMRYACSFDSQ